jgi:hypothetical protein
MSGKEALFKMIDLINTVIHALNDINADESNCVLNDLPKTEGDATYFGECLTWLMKL